jgi:4-amino-4-deoxy-L-arabinose transferase-like glycosyltransferase
MKGNRAETLGLALIVLAYLLIAGQYAWLNPPWQAPDEPAHYNYVRYVAEHGSLPVLEPGDYDHDYLEEIKARGFPPDMPIDPIRYQAWQPPLYYLMAVPVYRLTSGWPQPQRLVALRLLSVAFGAILLLVTDRVVRTLTPGRIWLALGATALVASVPMHVAMTAAANNDTLAGVWVGLVLWQLLARLAAPEQELKPWLALGVTLGLGGLTKISTLATLPLVLGVLIYVALSRPLAAERGRFLFHRLVALGVPALLLMLPWLARNAGIYGLGDPLAFARHDLVVQGQLRTADWVTDIGLRQAAGAFLTTTFHSFWGQFGWMGVPIDLRLYRGLAFVTGLALLGLLLRLPALPRAWRGSAPHERAGWLVLAASTAITGASLVWYNLSFVQHQGRYLFPALIPIAAFLAVGWREITRQSRQGLAAALALLAVLLVAARGLHQGQPLDKWLMAGILGLGGAFAVSSRLPQPWSRWLYALPYPLLLLLDLACLYVFILPALA